MLQTLEYLTDELTAATLKAQTLLTEFGIYCENCEMDGETPPAEFDDAEKRQLQYISTSAREALRLLDELAK